MLRVTSVAIGRILCTACRRCSLQFNVYLLNVHESWWCFWCLSLKVLCFVDSQLQPPDVDRIFDSPAASVPSSGRNTPTQLSDVVILSALMSSVFVAYRIILTASWAENYVWTRSAHALNPRVPTHPWKYLNFILLNSRPWKYLKRGQVLESP